MARKISGDTVSSRWLWCSEWSWIDNFVKDGDGLNSWIFAGMSDLSGLSRCLIMDLATSHSRPLSKDSACHILWEVYPLILQLKRCKLGTIGRLGENVRDLWRLRRCWALVSWSAGSAAKDNDWRLVTRCLTLRARNDHLNGVFSVRMYLCTPYKSIAPAQLLNQRKSPSCTKSFIGPHDLGILQLPVSYEVVSRMALYDCETAPRYVTAGVRWHMPSQTVCSSSGVKF